MKTRVTNFRRITKDPVTGRGHFIIGVDPALDCGEAVAITARALMDVMLECNAETTDDLLFHEFEIELHEQVWVKTMRPIRPLLLHVPVLI